MLAANGNHFECIPIEAICDWKIGTLRSTEEQNAVVEVQKACITYFKAKGVPLSHKDEDLARLGPIERAIQWGNESLVEFLIAENAPITVQSLLRFALTQHASLKDDHAWQIDNPNSYAKIRKYLLRTYCTPEVITKAKNILNNAIKQNLFESHQLSHILSYRDFLDSPSSADDSKSHSSEGKEDTDTEWSSTPPSSPSERRSPDSISEADDAPPPALTAITTGSASGCATDEDCTMG